MYKKATNGWDRHLLGDSRLTFDLSRCVAVDLAGTAQLLTVLERASLDGIQTEVILPAGGLIRREIAAWDRRVRDGVDITGTLQAELVSRHDVRNRLERFGFARAARLPHLTPDFRTVNVRDPRGEVASDAELTERLRRLQGALEASEVLGQDDRDDVFVPSELQLQWIDRLDRPQLASIVDQLERVLSQGREALPAASARSIARTVVYEALDNVRVHAKSRDSGAPTGAALLGAAFTTGTSGRRLRVVLGDSGAGLVHTLRSSFVPARHDQMLPSEVRTWKSHDLKTAVWAFHPLSTSRPVTRDEAPVRGLSRSRHQLQFHRGSIRLRTSDIQVVITEPIDELEARYQGARKGLIPGTLLDVTLNALRASLTVDDASLLGGSTNAVELLPFLVDASALGAEERLSGLTVDLREDTAVCLVVVGLDFGRESGYEAANHLARLTSIVAGRVTVCLIPDVPSGLMFSVLRSLSERSEQLELAGELGPESQVTTLPDDPVMVLGSDRKVTWWGPLEGREPDLLRLAAASGFGVPAPQLEAEEIAPDAAFDGASPALQRWVRGGALAFDSGHLDEALAAWLEALLSENFEKGGAGVIDRDHLLPSLEMVSKSVDIGAMLDGLGVAELAGQISGQLAGRYLSDSISLVVSLPDVPDRFGQAFSVAAGYDGRRLLLDPGREGWRTGPAPEHHAGKAVVLAGVVHRGDTVRAVLEALMRWGLEPQLAVLVADARPRTEAGLRALDKVIPVTSLVRLTLPPSRVPFADLLVHEARAAERQALSYDIAPSELADILANHGDGFRLVHIERSEDRHFVGYYDFRTVLADDQLRAAFAEKATLRIRRLTPGGATRSHLVLYPADDENRAAVLAQDVAGRLNAIEVRPLPRDGTPIGPSPLFANGSTATFVDWGVVTARTARRALYELAQAGAAHANFVAIASQLDAETEVHLRGLAAVHGRQALRDTATLPLEEPSDCVTTVAFRPLTRIAATAYSRATCPLCRVVSEFVALAASCPSTLLQNIAEEKVELLRARPRDEALSATSDMYGAELSYAERSSLIRLWSILNRARSSPVDRHALIEVLQARDDPDSDLTAASVCRILAARHDLLHYPPLSDDHFRGLVVEVVLPVLCGPTRFGFPLAVRRQAVVVLRAASKQRFVQEIVSVLSPNIRSRAVVAEVLLATYSIMRRPYYQGSGLMDALVGALNEAQDLVQEAYREGRTDPDVVQAVRSLRRLATTLRTREDSSDAQGAWAALRGAYRDDIREHHHAVNRLGQIGRQLNDFAMKIALASGDPEWIGSELRRIAESWDVCADFLASSVLPYLKPLKDVLLAGYYQNRCGDPVVWSYWSRFLASDATEHDLAFGRELSRLLREPSAFGTVARSSLTSEVAWMRAIFLGVRRPTMPERRQTLLYEWIKECPVPLSRFRDCLDSELLMAHSSARPVQLEKGDFDVLGQLVFLPDGLVQDIANTLVNNVQEHGSLPETETRLSLKGVSDRLIATFQSVGTAPGDVIGVQRGVEGLRRRVAAFGCQIDICVNGADFETRVSFGRWLHGG